MLVSIVITNYNYGNFVGEAIDSALSQTHPDVEVIVVDDGSTDASREVISHYGDRTEVVFRAHGGQLACVNAGFSRCRGDAVIFLDSDDILYEDAVARHVEKLNASGVVKSQGYLEVVDRAGLRLGGRIPVRVSPSGNYRERFLRYGPRSHRCTFTSGNAWKRSFLDKVMPLPEEKSGLSGPDGYLATLDPLYGSMAVVEGPVARYRVHGMNIGPMRYRFDLDYLKGRRDGYAARVALAAAAAEALGYQVDTAKWFERAGWKLNLTSHVIYLMGSQDQGVPFGQLVLSPLREADASLSKGLVRSLLLALVGLLPRPLALRLAKETLDRSWGRRGVRA